MTFQREIIMKIGISVKSLNILGLVLLLTAVAVSAQRKPAASTQGVWRVYEMERWGFSFSAPKDIKEIPSTEDSDSNSSDGNFSESRTYRRSVPKAQRIEISIYLRNSKGEKIKTERDGKPIELTPLELMLLDFAGDTSALKNPDSPVVEAKFYDIGEETGSLVVMNNSPAAGKSVKPTNDIRVIWGIYRLFKGNVQQIMFSLEGKRAQLATMMKIIDSMKFKPNEQPDNP